MDLTVRSTLSGLFSGAGQIVRHWLLCLLSTLTTAYPSLQRAPALRRHSEHHKRVMATHVTARNKYVHTTSLHML